MCGDGLAVALSKIQLCQRYTALGYYVLRHRFGVERTAQRLIGLTRNANTAAHRSGLDGAEAFREDFGKRHGADRARSGTPTFGRGAAARRLRF